MKVSPKRLAEQSQSTDNIPWLNHNPADQGMNLGQFRLAEAPLEFLVRRKCILDHDGDPFRMDMVYGCGEIPEAYADNCLPNDCASHDRERIRFEEANLTPMNDSPYHGENNRLDKARLSQILKEQYGSCFERRPESWRYRLCLAFAKIAAGDFDKGQKILDSMNRALQDVLAPEEIEALPVESCDLCAAGFENLAIARWLSKAREKSVVPTSRFGWVKAFDRTLWYCLSNLGRKAVFAEGMAVTFHLEAEQLLGHEISERYVEPCIDAIERLMISEGWIKEKN